MLLVRSPRPSRASSSSRKRSGGSCIGSLSRGSPFEVQAMSGACVGLYLPVLVRWRMDFRNSSRFATLDALPPELAEGLLCQRREVARVRPPAHRTGDGPDEVISQKGLLGNTARSAGEFVQGRTLHRVLEDLEGRPLGFARETLFDLAVAKLQEEVVQRDAHGARLRARATEGGGVWQVSGLLVPLEQGRYDSADRAGIGRAVGVTAGLAVDGADVQAVPAADAVEGLLELRAQELRAAVVQKYQVHLVRPVELALPAWSGDEVGVYGDLLSRTAPRQELDEDREVREARDHLLYPHHDHVDRRDAGDQPGVALVGDGHDRPRLGHPKVCPRHPDVGGEELLPEALAGKLGQVLDVRRQPLPGHPGEDIRYLLAVHVENGADNVRGMVVGELGDPLPKVRLDDLQPEIGVVLLQTTVELYLLGCHALGLRD